MFQPIRKPKEPSFEGGRALVLEPYKCDMCGLEYAVASCLVQCKLNGEIPYMNSKMVAN